jgi:dephospho-CoA kinase
MSLKIAIGGKMGSGKDTSVDYLSTTYGGEKIAFSESIYNILYYSQLVCGFEQKKDRKFLQIIGDWAKTHNPQVWINLALDRANQIISNDKETNVYISDIRYLNELEALADDGWLLIRIDRDSPEERLGTGDLRHSSETTMDTIPTSAWHYVIKNNGTLETLYESLDTIIKFRMDMEKE